MKLIDRIAFREATHDRPERSRLARAGMVLGSLAAVAFPGMMISGLAAQNKAVTEKPAAFAEAFSRQLPEGMVPIGSEGAGSPNSTSIILPSSATEGLSDIGFGLPTGSFNGIKVDFFTAQYPNSGSQPTKECPKGGAIVGQGIAGLSQGDTITVDGQSVCVAQVTEGQGYVGRVGMGLPQGSLVSSAMKLSLAPVNQANGIIKEHFDETGQRLEVITPEIMRKRTERLWEDSSNSLFGLAKNLGAIAGLLLVGGLAGFNSNRRKRQNNDLRLAGATKPQIFSLESKTSALTLIPGAVLGSAVLSRLVVSAANSQTLNLGAELSTGNIFTGFGATVAAGAVATAGVAWKSARNSNPRGEA